MRALRERDVIREKFVRRFYANRKPCPWHLYIRGLKKRDDKLINGTVSSGDDRYGTAIGNFRDRELQRLATRKIRILRVRRERGRGGGTQAYISIM